MFNAIINYLLNLKYQQQVKRNKKVKINRSTAVGIVTLQDQQNYGNRLQNVALTQIIKKFGYHPVSLLPKMEQPNFKGLQPLLRQKQKNLIAFSERYLEYDYVVPAEWQRFAKVIVGSDQVWNTTWMSKEQFKLYLLTTVPPRRRVAYAASMGRHDFASQQLSAIFNQEITKFHYTSARESQVADVIAQQIHKEVPIVLDPVLLLDANDWEKTLTLDQSSQKEQVFTYFLTPQTEKVRIFIADTVTQNKLNLVAFNDARQAHNFVRDPRAFVQEIRNSKLVITDSFHATVFAIIFKVPFITVSRSDGEKMSSRLEQLFCSLGLEPRWLIDVPMDNVFKINFDPVTAKLEIAQRESLNFLKTALQVEEKSTHESY